MNIKNKKTEVFSLEKFSGQSSSDAAKKAYVPVSDFDDISLNVTLGKNSSAILLTDPKLILFTLSKYKFAGKILEGKGKVLEVGCMEGLGSLLLDKFVNQLVSIDFFKGHIREAKNTLGAYLKNVEFLDMDFLDSSYKKEFDGLVCFDVLEHVDPKQANLFVEKIYEALKDGGTAIIGMPSELSQNFASEANRSAHINIMSRGSARKLFSRFKNIFEFGMNDEVVHTGYPSMCHYDLYLLLK